MAESSPSKLAIQAQECFHNKDFEQALRLLKKLRCKFCFVLCALCFVLCALCFVLCALCFVLFVLCGFMVVAPALLCKRSSRHTIKYNLCNSAIAMQQNERGGKHRSQDSTQPCPHRLFFLSSFCTQSDHPSRHTQ